MKYAREAIDNAILQTAREGRFSLREFQFSTPSTSLLGPQDFKFLADEYTETGYDVSLSGYNNNIFTISWQKQEKNLLFGMNLKLLTPTYAGTTNNTNPLGLGYK